MGTTQSLIIDTEITAARKRLARIVRGGRLTEVSPDPHDGARTHPIRVGPVPGVPKLAQVRCVGPVRRDAVTTVWLRLEAAGGRFPVLDADLTLTPEGLHKTRLTLDGRYRPPSGHVYAGLDRAVAHHAATRTARALLREIAGALDEPCRATADSAA